MPFNRKPQKFNASIKEVTIGCGEKAVTLGGENVYPFYSFDGEITNAPKVAVEISDMGVPEVAGLKAYYEGCSTMAEIAKRASEMEGADFVCLRLEGGDPNGANKSVDELIAVVKEVADAIDVPLAVEGCKNVEKDGELLPKVAEALQGKNALILSAREEDYKSVGAAAGLAYDQKVGAESAVDINLAKQLNVVTTQLGVPDAYHYTSIFRNMECKRIHGFRGRYAGMGTSRRTCNFYGNHDRSSRSGLWI